MNPVGEYRGVIIFEEDGFYHPSVDTNVEGCTVQTIIEFIDEIFFPKQGDERRYTIQASIIGDYIEKQHFLIN